MATYYHSNGGGNSGKNDWGSWIPIIILFCIPTPVTWIIALIWLVSKLRGGAKRGSTWRSGNVKRHPYDIERDRQAGHPYDSQEWEQVTWEDSQSAAAQPNVTYHKAGGEKTVVSGGQTVKKSSAKKSGSSKAKSTGSKKNAKKKATAESNGSMGLIIGGAITSGVFGLGFLSTLFELVDSLRYGYFFSEEIVGVAACGLFFLGGLAMLLAGIGGRGRGERYVNYLAYIGANREVDLARMAAAFDVSVRKLCKDLRHMLAKGILPTGYLDLAEGKLYLTEMGYRAPEPEKEPTEEEKEEQDAQREDAILQEIRQVNDDIPDEEMSAKIDRIEEITGKILDYQKKHPNRQGQLRTFLNYYLPTTLKILRAYAQLEAQGIEGENISAAKARIESMMDQVVAGFEKQLDKLFQDDAMDIAADVEVLENMLKKDGLSDGQGITLGL